MTSLIYFYGKNVIYQVEAADSLKNVVTVYIKTHCRQKNKAGIGKHQTKRNRTTEAASAGVC